MNSMNKQVQENTIQSQNEWNACLLFRNKQLTKEVKNFVLYRRLWIVLLRNYRQCPSC